MNKFVMGIGTPGSGKTTILKQFAEKYGYSYICPDDIRAELTGNISDLSKDKDVWAEARHRTEKALMRNSSVIFDATFSNYEQRKDFLKFAREVGAEKIQGVFVDVPVEIAKSRNAARDRNVPEDVIDRMKINLQNFPPEISDGFDALFTLDEYQKIQEVERLSEGEISRKTFR